MIGFIYAAVLLMFSTILVSAEGEAPSAETLRVYERWAAAYNKFEPDLNDAVYQSLLRKPDGDLIFLLGIHHVKDPIRRLSSEGLGRLKTDRSFEVLVKGLDDKDMFVRERCLRALAKFQQKRCVAPMIGVLKNDPLVQLRGDAVHELGTYDYPDVPKALLDSLKNDAGVAEKAAYSLGRLRYEEAIPQIHQLILRLKDFDGSEGAIDGLRQFRTKQVIPIFIDLLEEATLTDRRGGKSLAQKLDCDLLPFAEKTIDKLGDPPDTCEQWREWWKEAEPLFNDKMEIVSENKPKKTYTSNEFGDELNSLKLSIAVDSESYRPGDPIRLDIVFRNTSTKPFEIVLPDVPSRWHPTMGWGVKLNRLGKNPISLIDIEPSGFYEGSYSGPPNFRVFEPREYFLVSICLQYWLDSHRIWPLSEGTYELALSFDSSQFLGIKPKGPQRTGLWKSPAIHFDVAGEVRKDPESLLNLVGTKTNRKWLRTDLTSRRTARRMSAWLIVFEYGDSRLLPLLEKLAGEDAVKDNLRWRSLRQFSVP
jgi:hypothetical protein